MTWQDKLNRPIPVLFETLVLRGLGAPLATALDIPFQLGARRLEDGNVSYRAEDLARLRTHLSSRLTTEQTYLVSFCNRCWRRSNELIRRSQRLGSLRTGDPDSTCDDDLRRSWSSWTEAVTAVMPFLVVFPAALDDVLHQLGSFQGVLQLDDPGLDPDLRASRSLAAEEAEAYERILRCVARDGLLSAQVRNGARGPLPSRLQRSIDTHLEAYDWLGLSYFAGSPWSRDQLLLRLAADLSRPRPSRRRPRVPIDPLVLLREHRKNALERSAHFMRPVLSCIAERTGTDYDGLLHLAADEIEAFLENEARGDALREKIAQRQGGFAVELKGGATEVRPHRVAATRAGGMPARRQAGPVEGQVASGGVHQGRARILRSPEDCLQVEPGDVVVTRCLTPDYVQAYQRAGAIVTEEGGVTCHAAAVSREMGIPCLIAAPGAIASVRDGELVVVDASSGERGTLRKASRSLPDGHAGSVRRVVHRCSSCVPDLGISCASGGPR